MKHILFTLYECDVELLDDRMYIENMMFEAATASNATFLNTVSHKFEPQGVTAVTLLAESHISIHTWPEEGMAVCDIFTCGDAEPSLGYNYMVQALKSQRQVHHEYERPFT